MNARGFWGIRRAVADRQQSLALRLSTRRRAGLTRRPSPGGLVSALDPVLRKRGGTWLGWPGGDIGRGRDPRAARRSLSGRAGASSARARSRATTTASRIAPCGPSSIRSRRARASTSAIGRPTSASTCASPTRPSRSSTPPNLSGSTTTSSCSCPSSCAARRAPGGWASSFTFPSPATTSTACCPGRASCCAACSPATWWASRSRATCATSWSAPSGFSARGSIASTGSSSTAATAPGSAASRSGSTAEDFESKAKAPPPLRGGRRERILFGADRLDYTKGIPERIRAVERLLDRAPRVPREGGAAAGRGSEPLPGRRVPGLKREIDELVGRVNGRFATPSWSPIRYIYQVPLSHERLARFYRDADVALVTPAARRDEPGRQGVRRLPGGRPRRAGALESRGSGRDHGGGVARQPPRRGGDRRRDSSRPVHGREPSAPSACPPCAPGSARTTSMPG